MVFLCWLHRKHLWMMSTGVSRGSTLPWTDSGQMYTLVAAGLMRKTRCVSSPFVTVMVPHDSALLSHVLGALCQVFIKTLVYGPRVVNLVAQCSGIDWAS